MYPSFHKDVNDMKIVDARQMYNTQIREYHEQQVILSKRKQELDDKIKNTPDGINIYREEAATLELTLNAVTKKHDEYKDYMEGLLEKWSAVANMESSKQQGEAMEKYAEDLGKIIEVARRIMKGGIVPPSDEKKLMDYSMEMYQAAKNIGAMAKKKKEEYDSLWDEEDEETPNNPDPMDVADNAEAPPGAPAVVDVADTMASVAPPAE